MDNMYRELILDHAENPRNWGLLVPADIDHEEHNPLCGDRLHLTLQLGEDRRIARVGWDGDGCAISQATASLLGERLVGLPLAEALKISQAEVLAMLGIPLTPNRMKCALLSLKTLVIGATSKADWDAAQED